MLVFRGLINYLFLLMGMVIILLMKIHIEKNFLPRLRIKNYNIEIIGRNFYDEPINDLINMMKSEKYQQDKVMITQLVVYWILLI